MDNGREKNIKSNHNQKQPLKAKNPMSAGKKVLLAVCGALILFFIIAGTYVLAFYGEVKETERVLLDDITLDEGFNAGVEDVFSERIVNIGLLGFDRGWNREAYGEYLFRPDMIAVFSINFETDEISVVRIPRDSYVPIHGTGGFHDKINHSYFAGYYYGGGEDSHADGIRYTLQTVSNTLGGIPIHYYVSVDMYSVIELVDAMGGIYYEVEQEIIDEHWEVGRVLVPEGPQIMDGKTFLRYLQYRDDATGQDYGRIDRQMNLLKETFLYLREKGRITDIPATYRIYKDYVETDLTYTQIAALAYYARDVDVTDETLSFYTLSGDGQTKDGIWYQVLREGERLQVIDEVFGIDAERWPPIVLEDSPEYLEEQKRKEREEREEREEEKQDQEEGKDEERKAEEGSDEKQEGTEGWDDKQEEALDGDVGRAERVEIPRLRGMTLKDAEELLEDLGFYVGEVTSRVSYLVEEGLVIGSDPPFGSRWRVGSEVGLVISEGPD